MVALAAVSGLGAGVLEAVLDYVCAQGMATEVTPGRYVATKLTNMLLAPVFVDAVTHFQFVDPSRSHCPWSLDIRGFCRHQRRAAD